MAKISCTCLKLDAVCFQIVLEKLTLSKFQLFIKNNLHEIRIDQRISDNKNGKKLIWGYLKTNGNPNYKENLKELIFSSSKRFFSLI